MSSDPAAAPTTADVVVIVDGATHLIARVRSPRCDLTLISDLLRLRLHVRRLGWTVELRRVDRRLGDLLALIGFGPDGAPDLDRDDDERLEEGDDGDRDQSAGASRSGGRSNSANRSG